MSGIKVTSIKCSTPGSPGFILSGNELPEIARVAFSSVEMIKSLSIVWKASERLFLAFCESLT
jgi:hypothetical protein